MQSNEFSYNVKCFKNSIHFPWFALSSHQHLLRTVSERNSLLGTGIMLTNDGLMQNKNSSYKNCNFMFFLETLQKHRVTFEDFQPQLM